MKLEGRDLSIDIQGEDVRLLHAELSQLDYEIPPNERTEMVFGRGAEAAVKEFQEKHGLDPSGVVDQHTADLINRALEDRQPTAPKTFRGKGTGTACRRKALCAWPRACL